MLKRRLIPKLQMKAASFGNLTRMVLVTTVHGWGVVGGWKTALYYWLDRRLVRRYEQVICVSRDLHERCLGLGVPEERCWLVPNAIDTEAYRLPGEAYTREMTGRYEWKEVRNRHPY